MILLSPKLWFFYYNPQLADAFAKFINFNIQKVPDLTFNKKLTLPYLKKKILVKTVILKWGIFKS